MRFDYRHWSLSIDPRNLVFVDEAGVHLAMTRLRGRAPKGQRVYDSCPRNRGDNISLLGAMSLDGLIATMSIPGSVNTEVFVTYLQQVLIPQLWQGAIVVLDNLPVHHATIVAQQLAAAGSQLVFVPPYSPDLSPIELCWSKVKQCLRSAKARSPEALEQALRRIVTEEISEENSIAWFAHCGLFI